MLDISKDIHSLSGFKRITSEFLERMRGSGHPLVLTINGKAELVVQDAAAYQKLLNRVDELEALDGIKRGLVDVAAGRVTPLRQSSKPSSLTRPRPMPAKSTTGWSSGCRSGDRSGSKIWSIFYNPWRRFRCGAHSLVRQREGGGKSDVSCSGNAKTFIGFFTR